jgi:hypothetical protein
LYARGIHAAAVTYPIVERGHGRLRFTCSASHTREDVDRTLEALIDAEREVKENRQALKEQLSGDSELKADPSVGSSDVHGVPSHRTGGGSSEAHPGRSGVEEWANAFCAYLKGALARELGPTPKLAVSIGLPDNGKRITILINERDITLGPQETTHTPFCSLLLTDNRSISALCSSDVQELLANIIKGACVLNGQAEPFIWLIGRMADWQRSGQR